MGIDDEIQAVEEEIANTSYNKATQHHIGKLKAKLARLREEQEKRQAAGKGGGGYAVRKSGHATVGLVGLPSVGKSTLLNALTNAESEVGAYEFTTLDVIPGMMEHRHANIQVLDLPGIIRGAAKNKGRGREVIAVARTADLILLVVDPFNPDALDVIVEELRTAHIRLNTDPPNVRLSNMKMRGGIDVQFTVKPTHLTPELAEDIVREWGHVNADVVIRDDVTADELVDVLAGNRVYTRAIVVVNKADLADSRQLQRAVTRYRRQGWTVVPVSAEEQTHLAELKDAIYEHLDLIRVYMKPQGKEADLEEPLVVRRGSTVGEVCDHLHRTFRDRFRYAHVTGPSAKFPDQRAGIDHVLEDKDVLTLILRK